MYCTYIMLYLINMNGFSKLFLKTDFKKYGSDPDLELELKITDKDPDPAKEK